MRVSRNCKGQAHKQELHGYLQSMGERCGIKPVNLHKSLYILPKGSLCAVDAAAFVLSYYSLWITLLIQLPQVVCLQQ